MPKRTREIKNEQSQSPRHKRSSQPSPDLKTWKTLCNVFQNIELESGRNNKIQHLCDYFESLLLHSEFETLLASMYLATATLAPSHAGIELGIGDALVTQAIANLGQTRDDLVKQQIKTVGDIGTVAQDYANRMNISNTQTHLCSSVEEVTYPLSKSLCSSVDHTIHEDHKCSSLSFKHYDKKTYSVTDIHEMLLGMADDGNKMVVTRHMNKILMCCKTMTSSANDGQVCFLFRILVGKMRLGVADSAVIAALASAYLVVFGTDKKKKDVSTQFKKMYTESPDYSILVHAIKTHGSHFESIVKQCQIHIGLPIRPMLATAQKDVQISSIVKSLDTPFLAQYKLDGERTQLHIFTDDKHMSNVKIYSRSGEDQTPKYTDFIQHILPFFTNVNCILDGEIVAYNRTTREIKPFAILSHHTEDHPEEIAFFVFDLLYYNHSLLDQPLYIRQKLLYEHITPQDGFIIMTPERKFTSCDTDEDVMNFVTEAVEHNCEGLVLKKLNGTYEPSVRCNHWLKLKEDYIAGLGDSFDLVPIGAFFGRGKRTSVYGTFLMAVRVGDRYQTICKLGTGFSDALLNELKSTLVPIINLPDQPTQPANYDSNIIPDVWLKPTQVWEVLAASMSQSPIHTAMISSGVCIGLRFPRLVRVRNDKTPSSATNIQQVEEMLLIK